MKSLVDRAAKLSGLLAVFAISTLLLVSFQNCSGGFSSANLSAATTTSSSSPAPSQPSLFAAPFTPKRTITVCASGCDYTLPSQAIANSQDYDLIEIKSGTYVDCAQISTPHLWIEGVGGSMPHIENKVCDEKGIFVNDAADLTVDNIEFSGMQIPATSGNNGAGIRTENGNLLVRNCYFHDGQEGILGGNLNSDVVTVANSHFARLGADGQEHDIYIGHVAEFTLQNSLMEQAYLGHEVKTRALKSVIECNEILGGYDVSYPDSYNIDMPNGGEEQIADNLIAQGPYSQNHNMVAFGEEGAINPTQSISMSGNILINDLGKGDFLYLATNPAFANLAKNDFIGSSTTIAGTGASVVTQSADQTFSSRAAAGYSQQFPLPTSCTGSVGNVAVP